MNIKPLLFFTTFAISMSGFAQSPGNVSSPIITDRPSAIRPKLPEFAPKQAPSGLIKPGDTPDSVESSDSGPKIFIREIRFSGHTAFSNEQLQTIAAPYVDRAISVSELEQLRHRLSQYYVENGYVNSGAILPSQTFENGIIHFDIIEGRLDQIRITGTGRLDPDYIHDRLQLGAGPPLNNKELEQRFQLLLQDPLIDRMEGRLSPGLTPGQSILDLSVTRAKPYQLAISTNNYRPPSTGSEQGRLDGLVRNLTGFGDTVDLSFGGSGGSIELNGGFAIPITHYDTVLSFRGNYNRSEIIEKPLEELNITSKSWRFDVGVNQPIFRSLQRSFYVGAKFEIHKNRNKLAGERFSFTSGEENGISKITALRFSQDYIESHSNQVIAFRSNFSVGINLFDPTRHGDGRADGDFYTWLGQLQYARQVLDNGAQLQFRGNVQLSSDPLLPLEQFALGGVHSVRGYRENELVRDQGYDLSLEFRYPALTAETIGGFPGILYVIPFMDYGGAWNVNNSNDTAYLHSVGIGMRWIPIPRLTAEIYYAHDLNTAVKKNDRNLQDRGVFFGVTFLVL